MKSNGEKEKDPTGKYVRYLTGERRKKSNRRKKKKEI